MSWSSAESMTFLTAMVWNTESDMSAVSGFEPGANSFSCGKAIYESLEEAWGMYWSCYPNPECFG